ncbi:unnamed protein product, partial [Gulo gulo]
MVTACPPLSVVRDRHRPRQLLLFGPRRLHLCSPWTGFGSGFGSGSQANPLEVPSASNFHVGLPAGAGAKGRS